MCVTMDIPWSLFSTHKQMYMCNTKITRLHTNLFTFIDNRILFNFLFFYFNSSLISLYKVFWLCTPLPCFLQYLHICVSPLAIQLCVHFPFLKQISSNLLDPYTIACRTSKWSIFNIIQGIPVKKTDLSSHPTSQFHGEASFHKRW